MKNMYVVGTLHQGCVPEEELVDVLESFKPDQLFLELPDEPLEDIVKSGDIRDEMIYAYQWAKKNNILVHCFDSEINTFRDGITVDSPEFKKLLVEQTEILKNSKITWKQHNKKQYDSLLDHPLIAVISDPAKELQREKDMLQKIRKHSIQEGVILILTGAGHLSFFESELPEATFPFRR
jgi:pheromone shutdown protein TraB